MSKLRLMQVSSTGRCKEIAYNDNIEDLKSICGQVMKSSPDMDYGIVDDSGYFVWPEKFIEKQPLRAK